MKRVPEEVHRLWDNNAFVTVFPVIKAISLEFGAAASTVLLDNNSFGSRTVIGMALVTADGDGTKGTSAKTPTNGALLTYAQAQLSHITFKDANDKPITDKLPLTMLLPRPNDVYVPFYLENFNPSKSSVEWCATLGNTTAVNLELILFCL
jgi:hypothetical protein